MIGLVKLINEGEVVAVVYGDGNAEAIVSRAERVWNSVSFIAWRAKTSRDWTMGDGQMPVSSCAPHPDQDSAVAAFMSWRLTQ